MIGFSQHPHQVSCVAAFPGKVWRHREMKRASRALTEQRHIQIGNFLSLVPALFSPEVPALLILTSLQDFSGCFPAALPTSEPPGENYFEAWGKVNLLILWTELVCCGLQVFIPFGGENKVSFLQSLSRPAPQQHRWTAFRYLAPFSPPPSPPPPPC